MMVKGLEKKLKKRGIPIEYGGAIQNGNSRSIYILDPNGYDIELSENVGGGLH